MSPFIPAASLVVLLAALPGLASAQATGTITGVVADAVSAVLPGATVEIGTANFGRITAAEDGRIIQLAVKYSF